MFKVISKNENKVIRNVYSVRTRQLTNGISITEFFIWDGYEWFWVNGNLYELYEEVYNDLTKKELNLMLSKTKEAIMLLDSMVLCGERHSEKSTRIVGNALDIIYDVKCSIH